MAFLVRCPCGRPRRVEQSGAFECADVECGRTLLAGRHSQWGVPYAEVLTFWCSPHELMTSSTISTLVRFWASPDETVRVTPPRRVA